MQRMSALQDKEIAAGEQRIKYGDLGTHRNVFWIVAQQYSQGSAPMARVQRQKRLSSFITASHRPRGSSWGFIDPSFTRAEAEMVYLKPGPPRRFGRVSLVYYLTLLGFDK